MPDSEIDELFARARAEGPGPDARLLARIEAEGLSVQAGFRDAPPIPVRRMRGLPAWVAALGGRAALAGLATTALAGVWIGVVQPAPLAAVTSGLTAALGAGSEGDYVELIPGFDSLGTEG